MTYMMVDGLVRRTDDPDWARPALASESWAFAEIERLRTALRQVKEMGEGKVSSLPLAAWRCAAEALGDLEQPVDEDDGDHRFSKDSYF